MKETDKVDDLSVG